MNNDMIRWAVRSGGACAVACFLCCVGPVTAAKEPSSDQAKQAIADAHPGVTVDEVRELTGFALTIPGDVAVTPEPTQAELRLIRERLDPAGLREAELR